MAYVQLFANSRLLATSGTLADVLGQTVQAVTQRLQNWNPDELLNTPVDDVVEYLVDEGSVRCPQLRVGDAYQLDSEEVDQEFEDFGRRLTRRVVRLVLVVPFDGDKDVFTLRADMFSMAPPQVLQLQDGEVHLAIDNPPKDPAAIRAGFNGQVDAIEKCLAWSQQQIDAHNQYLRDQVPGMVARRREELLATRNLLAEIGFPIRRRADADRFAVPVTRKTVRPQHRQPPSGVRAPFKPEPVMQDQDYQDALRVLRNQRNALERTPSVAGKLSDEEIRDVLLMGLNSQFEGAAGGELFNGEGKTDILVRVDDRNIFIGECKVWSGPKTMDDALGQLFRYLVWRDTKAAILLFIRNKDVTAVIEKAIAKIEGHPNYKRSSPLQHGDDEFEFTMHAQDDPNREIRLALLPFALRLVEK